MEQHSDPVIRAIHIHNWQKSFKRKEKKTTFAGFEFNLRIMCPDKTKKNGKTQVEIFVPLESEEYRYLLLKNLQEAKLIKNILRHSLLMNKSMRLL